MGRRTYKRVLSSWAGLASECCGRYKSALVKISLKTEKAFSWSGDKWPTWPDQSRRATLLEGDSEAIRVCLRERQR